MVQSELTGFTTGLYYRGTDLETHGIGLWGTGDRVSVTRWNLPAGYICITNMSKSVCSSAPVPVIIQQNTLCPLLELVLLNKHNSSFYQ